METAFPTRPRDILLTFAIAVVPCFKHYQQALEADRLVEYSPGLVEDLANLGRVSLDLGNKQEAADYYRRAYQIAVQLGHRQRVIENVRALMRIGFPTISAAELAELRNLAREIDRK